MARGGACSGLLVLRDFAEVGRLRSYSVSRVEAYRQRRILRPVDNRSWHKAQKKPKVTRKLAAILAADIAGGADDETTFYDLRIR